MCGLIRVRPCKRKTIRTQQELLKQSRGQIYNAVEVGRHEARA